MPDDRLEQEAMRARLTPPRQALMLLQASEAMRLKDFASVGATPTHPLQASPLLLETMARQDALRPRPVSPAPPVVPVRDDEFPF